MSSPSSRTQRVYGRLLLGGELLRELVGNDCVFQTRGGHRPSFVVVVVVFVVPRLVALAAGRRLLRPRDHRSSGTACS